MRRLHPLMLVLVLVLIAATVVPLCGMAVRLSPEFSVQLQGQTLHICSISRDGLQTRCSALL